MKVHKPAIVYQTLGDPFHLDSNTNWEPDPPPSSEDSDSDSDSDRDNDTDQSADPNTLEP